jgi:hypothetical protein
VHRANHSVWGRATRRRALGYKYARLVDEVRGACASVVCASRARLALQSPSRVGGGTARLQTRRRRERAAVTPAAGSPEHP